jgi:hypothetical protein
MGQEVLMRAKGHNGQLELFGDSIRITRKGIVALTQGHKGQKEILLSRISAIQFKPAGLVTNGYIHFTSSEGSETKGGIFNATRDENTVEFHAGQREAFEAIKQAIEERMALLSHVGAYREGNGPGAAQNASEVVPGLSVADELATRAASRERSIKSQQIPLMDAERRVNGVVGCVGLLVLLGLCGAVAASCGSGSGTTPA